MLSAIESTASGNISYEYRRALYCGLRSARRIAISICDTWEASAGMLCNLARILAWRMAASPRRRWLVLRYLFALSYLIAVMLACALRAFNWQNAELSGGIRAYKHAGVKSRGAM